MAQTRGNWGWGLDGEGAKAGEMGTPVIASTIKIKEKIFSCLK